MEFQARICKIWVIKNKILPIDTLLMSNIHTVLSFDKLFGGLHQTAKCNFSKHATVIDFDMIDQTSTIGVEAKVICRFQPDHFFWHSRDKLFVDGMYEKRFNILVTWACQILLEIAGIAFAQVLTGFDASTWPCCRCRHLSLQSCAQKGMYRIMLGNIGYRVLDMISQN